MSFAQGFNLYYRAKGLVCKGINILEKGFRCESLKSTSVFKDSIEECVMDFEDSDKPKTSSLCECHERSLGNCQSDEKKNQNDLNKAKDKFTLDLIKRSLIKEIKQTALLATGDEGFNKLLAVQPEIVNGKNWQCQVNRLAPENLLVSERCKAAGMTKENLETRLDLLNFREITLSMQQKFDEIFQGQGQSCPNALEMMSVDSFTNKKQLPRIFKLLNEAKDKSKDLGMYLSELKSGGAYSNLFGELDKDPFWKRLLRDDKTINRVLAIYNEFKGKDKLDKDGNFEFNTLRAFEDFFFNHPEVVANNEDSLLKEVIKNLNSDCGEAFSRLEEFVCNGGESFPLLDYQMMDQIEFPDNVSQEAKIGLLCKDNIRDDKDDIEKLLGSLTSDEQGDSETYKEKVATNKAKFSAEACSEGQLCKKKSSSGQCLEKYTPEESWAKNCVPDSTSNLCQKYIEALIYQKQKKENIQNQVAMNMSRNPQFVLGNNSLISGNSIIADLFSANNERKNEIYQSLSNKENKSKVLEEISKQNQKSRQQAINTSPKDYKKYAITTNASGQVSMPSTESFGPGSGINQIENETSAGYGFSDLNINYGENAYDGEIRNLVSKVKRQMAKVTSNVSDSSKKGLKNKLESLINSFMKNNREDRKLSRETTKSQMETLEKAIEKIASPQTSSRPSNTNKYKSIKNNKGKGVQRPSIRGASSSSRDAADFGNNSTKGQEQGEISRSQLSSKDRKNFGIGFSNPNAQGSEIKPSSSTLDLAQVVIAERPTNEDQLKLNILLEENNVIEVVDETDKKNKAVIIKENSKWVIIANTNSSFIERIQSVPKFKNAEVRFENMVDHLGKLHLQLEQLKLQ